ncbi:unnamed protein product [Echinostoma caproni]|uniref:Kinesin motor domain-containing protein n=1 Tax=Echinostoma caproni TaxID=27848 RepID=A0A183A7Z3_9TREM|nr:unnamed protein product [Echinostoma caproni]
MAGDTEATFVLSLDDEPEVEKTAENTFEVCISLSDDGPEVRSMCGANFLREATEEQTKQAPSSRSRKLASSGKLRVPGVPKVDRPNPDTVDY